MGTLAFGLADPDGARLAGRLINKTEQLAWQEVHSGAVPPLPLLVTDARHACYQLSLLALRQATQRSAIPPWHRGVLVLRAAALCGGRRTASRAGLVQHAQQQARAAGKQGVGH